MRLLHWLFPALVPSTHLSLLLSIPLPGLIMILFIGPRHSSSLDALFKYIIAVLLFSSSLYIATTMAAL
jgi:hypothetical protein